MSLCNGYIFICIISKCASLLLLVLLLPLLLLEHVLAKLNLNEYYLKKLDNSDFSCLEHDLLLSVMLLSMTHV